MVTSSSANPTLVDCITGEEGAAFRVEAGQMRRAERQCAELFWVMKKAAGENPDGPFLSRVEKA